MLSLNQTPPGHYHPIVQEGMPPIVRDVMLNVPRSVLDSILRKVEARSHAGGVAWVQGTCWGNWPAQ